MKSPAKVRCYQRHLDQVIATIREVGYSGLAADERAIADAFDAGTLVILEPVSRSYNEMCRVNGERSHTAAY